MARFVVGQNLVIESKLRNREIGLEGAPNRDQTDAPESLRIQRHFESVRCKGIEVKIDYLPVRP